MAETRPATQLDKLNNTVMAVQDQIADYVSDKLLDIPPNYSVGNALKQAQLIIQANDKLMACTQVSIARALMDMCVLGLNVNKGQAYIVPFGNQATLIPSYMGKKTMAMRIDKNVKDIIARVVKKGEDFRFENDVDGYVHVVAHQSTLESMMSKEILAAYATIIYKDGSRSKSLIMTFDRIKESWKMSKANPFDEHGRLKQSSVHARFTEEMCCKTVITAICNPIIRASNDSDLFGSTAQAVNLNSAHAEEMEEVDDNTSTGDFVDIVEGEDILEMEVEEIS